MKAKTGEAATQRLILDYLAVRGVLAFRMNIGTMTSEYKGKQRFMRFGTPGMADIMAFQLRWDEMGREHNLPIWIEVKAEKGVQSELQKSFQKQVESHGHRYILARSLDDVEDAL
jgi:hypothetical protein